MNDLCEQFARLLEEGLELDQAEASRWREHARSCARCRRQAASDAALRAALAPPPPVLSAGFETRLRRRLLQRGAGGRLARRRPGRLAPSVFWTLAAYGTAATLTALVILSRLPWDSLPRSPILGLAVAALVLLSPLALLDRIGIVRPPGG